MVMATLGRSRRPRSTASENLEATHGDQPGRTGDAEGELQIDADPQTVFRFQATDGGTLARSEESWEGLIARLLKGYSRKTLDKGIRSVLAHLKTEAERRAAA
jgi:hypothetical protein